MSGSNDAGRLLVRIEATTAQLRQQLQQAEQQVGATSAKIDQSLKKADDAFARMNAASKAAQEAVAGLNARLGPLGGLLGSLGPAGVAAGAGVAALGTGLVAVAKAGDAATATLARLTSATGSVVQAQQVYEQLFALSQQTGVAVSESAGAFSRFRVAATEIGATNAEVLKLVTGVQKAGIVAGSSMQETAAATMQLGQALASGRLQGDELRSLLENMPTFAQALARELGVGIGRLREMGTEGLLTAEVVFPALLRASEKMNEQFDKLPPTMGRAFGILGESMAQFGADLDKALGVSQAIARAAKAAADAVNGVRESVFRSDAAQNAADIARLETDRDRLRERARNAEGEISAYMAGGLSRQQALALALPAMPGQTGAGDGARLAATERELAEHYDRRMRLMLDAQTREQDEQQQAAQKALEARRQSGQRVAEALEKDLKTESSIREKYRKQREQIDQVERSGARTAEQIAALRAAAAKDEAEELEKLAKANDGVAASHGRVAKAAADADSHVKAYYKDQEEAAKAVAKAQEKAAEEIRRFHERSFDAVVNIGERAFDRLGDALVNAFVSGEGAAVNFGNVLRAVVASAAADIAKLAIVNPLLNEMFTSTNGPRPTLAGAFGSSGGIGSLFGMVGGGGGISNFLVGQSAVGAMGPQIPSAGILGSGGNLFGVSGLGLGGIGSSLGMIGAGIGVGNLLGGLVANSAAQRENAMYGSLLGTLLGGPFGGAFGGLVGGLIGPGESVRGYGLRFQSNAYNEAVGGTSSFGSALNPIDRTFYNEEGAAAFAEAERQVAATNEYLNTRNLRVAGASVIGGNKNGPDYSWADAGTIGEGFSRLRFAAMDNTNLDEQLRQRNFQGVEGLQQFVEQFIRIQDTIKGLTTDAIPAFTAQMQAVNDNFDAVIKSAQQYGVAETGLTEARAKAIAALEAQRTETLRQSDVSLSIRRLAAGGDTQQAELVRQAEAARQELEAFGKSLDALAVTAADKAARLVALEEVQAAERAAIIERYGEQAAQALRQAGSTIRAYLDNLATGTAAGASPTDRLAAAQANFERDRLLATGGDRDALGRITGSADALLGAGRDMFASGSGFQAILQQVTGGLTNLPVVQSYDAQQTAALQAIQQALTTGTLNTATVILPAGNVVQLAGGAFSAASAADIAATAQATANTVGTLVSGFGQSIAATATGLAAVNQSLGAVNTSVVDLNRSLATIHGSLVAGFGGLGAAQATTAGLTAAVNDNVLATGRAQQEGQAVANALLGAIPAQVLASGGATLAGLAGINQSLAALHSAMADLNTSIATVHGSLVAGLGVLANGAAALAAGQDITARAVVAAGAALQEGQAVGNAGLGILAGGLAVMNGSVLSLGGALATIDATGRDVNTSLATIHGAAVDLNTSLATIHSSLVVGLGALAGGISIAAQQAAATNASVITAGAAVQSGQAVANAIEVANAAAFATYYGIMTTYLAIIAANTASVGVPSPVPAPGYTYGGGRGGTNDNLGGILTGATYGGGINGGPGSVENVLTGYTAQVLNGGTRPAQPDSLGVGGGVVAPMLAELQAINGRLVAVEGVLRQVGIVVAQETRASGVLVAGALDEQTTVIRRTAA
jgi:tape measure domain-containing protein